MSAAFALIVFFPLGEELIRAVALRGVHGSRKCPDKTLRVAIGYGLGFGFWEAGVRWLSFAISPVSITVIIGTLVPILMHVLLSLVMWLHIRNQKPLLGLAICIAIHAAHNTYVVLLVTQFNTPQFALDVLGRLLIVSGAISWLTHQTPKAAGLTAELGELSRGSGQGGNGVMD